MSNNNITTELDELREKCKVKKNTGSINTAVDLLKELISDADNIPLVAEYLLITNAILSERFLQSCKLNSEQAEKLITEIIKNERFGKNESSISYTRGFAIVAQLLKNKDHSQISSTLALNAIHLGDKKTGFAKDLIYKFNLYIVEQNLLDDFMKLKVYLKEYELRTFDRFIAEILYNLKNKTMQESNALQATESSEKFTNTVNAVASKHKQVDNLDASVPIVFFDALEKKIASTINYAFDNQNSKLNAKISDLKSRLSAKEQEILTLKKETEQYRSVVEKLEFGTADLKKRISQLEEEVEKQKKRADAAYQMDTMGKEQAIITLKSKIANALKLEYEEFEVNRNAELDEDNFEANKASLQRIFKILKRFGINIE